MVSVRDSIHMRVILWSTETTKAIYFLGADKCPGTGSTASSIKSTTVNYKKARETRWDPCAVSLRVMKEAFGAVKGNLDHSPYFLAGQVIEWRSYMRRH